MAMVSNENSQKSLNNMKNARQRAVERFYDQFKDRIQSEEDLQDLIGKHIEIWQIIFNDELSKEDLRAKATD